MTDSVNLRLKFRNEQVIFNWERNQDELRFEDPVRRFKVTSKKGRIPVNEWVHVTLLIQDDVAKVYLNDEECLTVHADYKSAKGYFYVYPGKSIVTVKSVSIVELPDAK